MLKLIATAVLAFTFAFFQGPADHRALAQDQIKLPPVVKSGGTPLMDALNGRHSERGFKSDPLSERQLSEILWAAAGVNRDDGRLTIPTARDRKEIAVYAVLPTGVYKYDAAQNALNLALAGDFTQEYAASPLTLLFAAPNNSMGALHVGSAYQSAGLYCASADLANVVKLTGIDVLKGKLALDDGFEVLAVQSVGLPSE
ncbi:MAG: nitroreductase family protein [Deltaproteobacteria bacterium]|jgi:hypothetical protein|nr:nitroreductase family protein [Deltaproteobacteria bacterium]